MTALEVLQNVLSLMDDNPGISLYNTLLVEDGYPQITPSYDKAVELLMAYADPFDTDTPSHRLYGRLYRWCRSVNLETQRDAVVWAIGCLTTTAKPILTDEEAEQEFWRA